MDSPPADTWTGRLSLPLHQLSFGTKQKSITAHLQCTASQFGSLTSKLPSSSCPGSGLGSLHLLYEQRERVHGSQSHSRLQGQFLSIRICRHRPSRLWLWNLISFLLCTSQAGRCDKWSYLCLTSVEPVLASGFNFNIRLQFNSKVVLLKCQMVKC